YFLPRIFGLLRTAHRPIRRKESVTGAVVPIELVLFAGRFQRSLRFVDLLRSWKLVLVAKYPEQRTTNLWCQIDRRRRVVLVRRPSLTAGNCAAPAVDRGVEIRHLAGSQIRQTPA